VHARNLAQTSGARLVLVVDQDASLARAAAGELRVPWSASYEQALAERAVDAVVIATPTPLHASMVEQAAAAGKHVFCEKPLSLDLESGRAATAAARDAAVALQVGFQRRFDPDFQAARAHVAAGALGAVQLLRISHRNRVPPHAGELTGRLGSPFVDMTIHDFDTARWLVGEIAEVHAFASPGTGVVVARFETGALAVIDNTRAAAYGFECAVELMGDRSTLRIGWAGSASGVEQLTSRGRTSPLPADHVERHRSAYLEEIRHFVACVRSGAAPVVGGADSVAALRLSLAAERCAA
jgi:myo-inositol 2-dehydrogenase / D-chiro-inositol 1-dehydrogenase